MNESQNVLLKDSIPASPLKKNQLKDAKMMISPLSDWLKGKIQNPRNALKSIVDERNQERNYFKQLLGYKESKIPKKSELPTEFRLPSEITSILWQALEITNQKGKEVSFYLNLRNGAVQHTNFVLGSENDTGATTLRGTLENSLVSYIAMFKRPLASVHTHPTDSPGFSIDDLAFFSSNPIDEGYLFMGISNGGIYVLVRTEETTHIPFSSTLKKYRESEQIQKWDELNSEEKTKIKNKYAYFEFSNGRQKGMGAPITYEQIKDGVILKKLEIFN